MIKRLTLIIVLTFILASPAVALNIFYPADGTYVVHSDFLIIKAGDGVDGLTLDIGGDKSDLLDISSAEYKAAFADFLIVQPNWDAGKNTVKVEAYKGGKKTSEAQAEFFFQDNIADPPPSDYKRFIMHKPEQEVFCTGCHNMNPTPVQLETVGAENPCASCHKRMLEHKNVHGPAGAWQCVYCHDAKSSPVRYAPRKKDAKLCAECHEDIVGRFGAAKRVHGPVEVGMCSVCHDSHASDNLSQILRKANELCLSCHEGVDKTIHVISGFSGGTHPLDGVEDPSTGGNLTCVSCHDPHVGEARYYFRDGITSRMLLCQRCHKK